MVFGYADRTVNEFGLQQMCEVSITASADNLGELAKFINEAARELERADGENAHRHLPELLRSRLQCDFIINRPTRPNQP